MGQRVQVLVIKENKKGERKATFFHHQWGIGRAMYFGLLDLFMQDYYKDTFCNGYNYLNRPCFVTSRKYYDITDDVPRKVLENINPDDFATMAHVFDWGDNNNGGLVVYMKEDKKCEYHTSDFKIGFLLGPEDTHSVYENEEYNIGNDDEEFARWLTPAEYGALNINSDYADEEFIHIFEDFCKYFEIKYFENSTTMEENLSALKVLRDEFAKYEKEYGNDVPRGYDD